jgi:hypothetical protein
MNTSSPRATERGFDSAHFRQALSQFATGVTVITTRLSDGNFRGLTASSFNSVSLEPPLVLWSLSNAANSLPIFSGNSHYVINVLSAGQEELARRFARRGANPFDEFEGRERLVRMPQPQPIPGRRPRDLRGRSRGLRGAAPARPALPRRPVWEYRASLGRAAPGRRSLFIVVCELRHDDRDRLGHPVLPLHGSGDLFRLDGHRRRRQHFTDASGQGLRLHAKDIEQKRHAFSDSFKNENGRRSLKRSRQTRFL